MAAAKSSKLRKIRTVNLKSGKADVYLGRDARGGRTVVVKRVPA